MFLVVLIECFLVVVWAVLFAGVQFFFCVAVGGVLRVLVCGRLSSLAGCWGVLSGLEWFWFGCGFCVFGVCCVGCRGLFVVGFWFGLLFGVGFSMWL